MKKTIIIAILLVFIGSVGCSTSPIVENTDYSICGETSCGIMAEIDTGYFFVFDGIIYYADKENLTNWVPLCNKPECNHEAENDFCNASLYQNNFVQKDGKLYETVYDYKNVPYIAEIAQDGSGSKKVYDIPVEEEFLMSDSSGLSYAISPSYFVMYYGYLGEDGIRQKRLLGLDGEGAYTLYEGDENETTGSLIMGANFYWKMRGDDSFINGVLAEEGEPIFDSIWRINNRELKKTTISKEINLGGSYLSGDTLIYFVEQEGYYEVDLETGEKKFLFENQLENSMATVLTDDYIVESNRYLGNMPEEAYLKFYNGEEWMDVSLPDEIKNTDVAFLPVAVASDRIFFRQSYEVNGNTVATYLYYFMLNTENPELVCAGLVGNIPEEESTEEQEEVILGDIDFEDIVVFDNDEYLYKITSMKNDDDGGFGLYGYCENKSSENDYLIFINYATINGMQCNIEGLANIKAGEKEDDFKELGEAYLGIDEIRFSSTAVDDYKISDVYHFEAYTDIELCFMVMNMSTYETVEKYIHVYPYGQEKAEQTESFVRDIQETDEIIIDNEYMTLIVTGYETENIPGDKINLFVKNKTDQLMAFQISEEVVNGHGVSVWNPKKISPAGDLLFPNCSLFTHLIWDEKELAKIGISEIEDIEFFFRVYTPENTLAIDNGAYLVDETIMLTPES